MSETTSKQKKGEKSFFSPLVVFGLCAVFTLLSWFVADRSSHSENLARFDRSASSLLYSFKGSLTFYTNLLIATRNLLTLNPNLNADEFSYFVRGLNLREEYPGIYNIGYVRRLSASELRRALPELPERARESLREKKESYDIVYFVENLLDMSTSVRGMDLSVSPIRNEAMNRAARSGRPVATDRLIRLSAPDQDPGEYFFIVFVPKYERGRPLSTPEERLRALKGFVYGAFRAPFLFGSSSSGVKAQDSKLIVRVYDGEDVNERRLVFAKGNLEEASPEYQKEFKLEAADHTWTIVLRAASNFALAYSRFLPLMVLFVGVILTIGITLAARRASRFAKELQEDIRIRERAEAQLSEEKRLVELTSTIGTELKAEQDLESVVQMVTDVARELTGAEFGAFFYNTPVAEGSVMTLYSLSGADKSVFANFRGTFEAQGILRIEDLNRDPRSSQVGRLPVKSYLSAPVISKNGRILGSLVFGHAEPGVFTARSETLLQSLAIQAAAAMDNARLYRELSQARQAAEAANYAKSMFLANVSHEIRTPLGIMLGFAELTAEYPENQTLVADNIQKIIRNGRELTRIIGEVLDLSKIEANALLIEETKASLSGFLLEIEREWRGPITAKGIRFELIQEKELPSEIHTDVTRLGQILVNLLSNALKFTEQGFIRIRVSRIAGFEDSAIGGADSLRIEVEDSGIGISEEQRGRLFRAFSQGDNSITRRFGGSGLGLALSKELARALGGYLDLRFSHVGEGSVFSLVLPLRAASSSLTQADIRGSQVRSALEGVKILLIEDSIDNQLLISTVLQKSQAVVETAANGEEGVSKALKGDYDLVLMDIQMPVLDGYGAFARLKEAGFSKPVIALTAHALLEEKERAIDLGFTGYLTKPLNRQALVAAIGQAVQ